MQKIEIEKLRIIDVTKNIIPPKEPFGPDQISTGVINESLIFPLKQYQSAIDDTTYMMITMKSHLGTHIECPNHLLRDGKDITSFPSNTWFGRMVLFDVDLPPKALITRDNFEKINKKRLKENDIVLIHSSCTNKEDVPLITKEIAHYLLEKKVKMFGFDDTVGFAKPYKGGAHDILLENNIPLLEWVINLDKLQQDISFLIALPGLKVEGLDASPVWAVVIEGIEMI